MNSRRRLVLLGTCLLAAPLVVATTLGLGTPAASAEATRVAKLDHSYTDLEVFMDVGSTKHQIDAVERVIRSSPAIRRYVFVDKHKAYEEFKRIFRNKPKLVRSIRPSDLPVSFRVDTSSTAAADEFQRQAEDLDGVESAPLMYRPSVAQMLTTVRLCRQRGASFEVFMRVGASEQQLASTLAIMNALPGVTVVRVLNTDDAFVEFTKAFASQPDKLEGMRPEDLPMSIRFEGPKAADSMDRFRAAPGVESVEAPDAICVDVFRLLAEGQTEEQVAREVIERGWGEPT